MVRTFLLIILIAFLAFTTVALWQHGLLGFFALLFQNLATIQVFIDLGIALSLFLVWLWHDARKAGRSPWPWMVLILCSGSIGALIYLIMYKTEKEIAE